MKKHRLVLAFDFDGTLVSCREKQIYALEKSLRLVNAEYDQHEQFWSLKRNGATTSQALCNTGVDLDLARQISEHWVKHIETKDCIDKDVVMSGVKQTLQNLTEHADLILLSARRDSELFKYQLQTTGLYSFFKHCQTVQPGVGTSDLKSELLMAHQACCYIGDTESDMFSAIKANIPVYLLSTGQRNKQFLDRCAKENNLPSSFDCFADALKRVKDELLS